MINTYNESSLHKTLKEMYSLEKNAKTEVEKDGFVYDIINDDEIIEIQTQNLSKLFAKVSNALSKNENIRVVFTLITEKTILLQDENGNEISKRKSPKKQNIYSLFRELTGIYPILLEKNFTLEVLFVKTTEIRIQTDFPVQAKNGNRRFKKNWLKIDKKLDKIVEKRIFRTKSDYLNLLPSELPKTFTAKMLTKTLKTQGNLIIWVFLRMDLIEEIGIENKSRVYKIKDRHF